LTALVVASALVNACGGSPERPSPSGVVQEGTGGTRAPGGGGENSDQALGGAGGAAGARAEDAGTTAGESNRTPSATGGTAGNTDQTGAAGEPQGGATPTAGSPDSGPLLVPLCQHAGWGSGTRLPLSSPDDDVLRGVTPDGLTLLFTAGGRFYVAERTAASAAFGESMEVASGLGFDSVTVSADGLTLVGATASGFRAIARATRQDAFGTEPDDLAFLRFNAAVIGNPTNEVALEPLLAMNDATLVYSFVSPSNDDERPTLFASEWLGDWSFGQALAGERLLWAHGGARRKATGLSSDGLTLFYRDEVEGEFRSAWRERPSGEFDTFESLGDWASAAPNGDCTRLYYSADDGDGTGVDLFVAPSR
jgi:hypothetical protein